MNIKAPFRLSSRYKISVSLILLNFMVATPGLGQVFPPIVATLRNGEQQEIRVLRAPPESLVPGTPRRAVAIASGLGLAGESMMAYARAYLDRGFDVYFLEERRQLVPSEDYLVQATDDYAVMLERAIADCQSCEFHLLGYSLGGVRAAGVLSYSNFREKFPQVKSATFIGTADQVNEMPGSALAAPLLRSVSRDGQPGGQGRFFEYRIRAPVLSAYQIGHAPLSGLPELANSDRVRVAAEASQDMGINVNLVGSMMRDIAGGRGLRTIRPEAFNIPIHVIDLQADVIVPSQSVNRFARRSRAPITMLTQIPRANHIDPIYIGSAESSQIQIDGMPYFEALVHWSAGQGARPSTSSGPPNPAAAPSLPEQRSRQTESVRSLQTRVALVPQAPRVCSLGFLSAKLRVLR